MKFFEVTGLFTGAEEADEAGPLSLHCNMSTVSLSINYIILMYKLKLIRELKVLDDTGFANVF